MASSPASVRLSESIYWGAVTPLFLAYGFAIVVVSVVALQPFAPFSHFSRDLLILAVEEECCEIYFGALSQLGVLLWAASTAIGAFAIVKGRRQWVILMAVLSAALCLDDAYLIHELVLPAIGLAEWAAYLVYGVLGVALLVTGWREMTAVERVLLMAALAPLGASMFIDLLFTQSETVLLAEDGLKLMGISAWTACAWQAARRSTELRPH